jgi:hypothetical protein
MSSLLSGVELMLIIAAVHISVAANFSMEAAPWQKEIRINKIGSLELHVRSKKSCRFQFIKYTTLSLREEF